MISEYKYRPPIKYLIFGLLMIPLAAIFTLLIGEDEIFVSIFAGLFSLILLSIGISFLTMFFRKFKMGNIKIGSDFIEIPGRWKNRTRLNFGDILDIREFDTYDNVIEIESKQGIHLIERNWMKQKEFDLVKKKLQEYWMIIENYPQQKI